MWSVSAENSQKMLHKGAFVSLTPDYHSNIVTAELQHFMQYQCWLILSEILCHSI